MLGDVGHPGEHGPPLTPDEGKRTAEQWERALDARQRDAKADLRDADADERDAAADERDAKADLRDADADERDAAADERDAKANRRDRELLRDSATGRLQAQLETMPVIEQAKGMIMEQEGCTAEEAFDLLRKASQSSNVPVRELAALIVARKNRRSRNRDHHDPAG
ncbi:MAG TPA: ANTAR domain-containing protein [Trebonia sp.]|jgi:uncharacterized protein (DUF3084 family)|nr:ANTAR domain-containing protein [Trebonia sp.]